MKNILIFAGIAGIAAAIAIYFVSESDESDNDSFEEGYVSDEDIEVYDQQENTGPAYNIDAGFNAAY